MSCCFLQLGPLERRHGGQYVTWTVRATARHVYVLIVNTPDECVIGGNAKDVDAVVRSLNCHWFPLTGVSTVHCELLRPFEKPYRELHSFETTSPAGIQFFSGGWGRAYTPDRETAADAIVAQASNCIDFPRVIHAAYDSGIRFFLEMGPGNSCTRMALCQRFQLPRRSATSPIVSFQRYRFARSFPSTMQPPGKRTKEGFKSATICAKSARIPFGRCLKVFSGNSETMWITERKLPNYDSRVFLKRVEIKSNFFLTSSEMFSR